MILQESAQVKIRFVVVVVNPFCTKVITEDQSGAFDK